MTVSDVDEFVNLVSVLIYGRVSRNQALVLKAYPPF